MKPTYEELECKVESLLKCCDAMAKINASLASELEVLRPAVLNVRGYALGDEPKNLLDGAMWTEEDIEHVD